MPIGKMIRFVDYNLLGINRVVFIKEWACNLFLGYFHNETTLRLNQSVETNEERFYNPYHIWVYYFNTLWIFT